MSFWVKGNIHTHTTESDGDADPKSVMKWYKDHEYDFLVITDHNHRTIIDFDNNNPQSEKELVLIPGEEVTAHVLEDFAKNILNYGVDGKIPIHINGIDIKKVVEPIHTKDIVTTLQANIDAIKNAGGLVSLNHPNYKWAFDHTQISKLKNVDLLEIFNGHPAVNVYGAVGKYSCEQIWDNVLSNGQKIFGVATDDSHHYHDFAYNKSNPGRGWIVAKVKELSKNNIVSAIKSGDFYASTGIEMENIIITHDSGSPREQMMSSWESTTPGSYIGWGKSTQLGYGLGLNMGAKLAAPDKICINVMGDAAIGMTGMDLETASRNGIATLTIVFNIGVMAAERDVLILATEKYNSMDVGGNYTKVAEGLNVQSRRIESPEDIIPAIKDAVTTIKGGKPYLLEFIVKEGYDLSRDKVAGL